MGETSRNLERELFEQRPYTKSEFLQLPVVFHVLYAPGQSYPNEQQLWWQLENLNLDFASADPGLDPIADPENFSGKTADTEISFCIPRSIYGGKQAVSGITFIETKVEEWGANWDMCSSQSGGSDPVDPSKYLNIWVVNLADSVSGWAAYPSLGALGRLKPNAGYSDGIVIGFDFFGQDDATGGTAVAPYHAGKTLTHLVGNYLGLYDLWDEFSICADDYVDDTPIHNAPNYGCQEYKHVSTCHEQAAEMVMNFMDNSDDACQNMFTLGQKLRMQSMLAPGAPRAGLLHTPFLCETESAFAFAEQAYLPESETVQVPEALKLSIWPNPGRDETYLEFNIPEAAASTLFEIMIYNVQGQFRHRISGQAEGNSYRDRLNTSDWPSGVYLLYIHTSSGMVTGRFTVQH